MPLFTKCLIFEYHEVKEKYTENFENGFVHFPKSAKI